jgi:hypothetical protein
MVSGKADPVHNQHAFWSTVRSGLLRHRRLGIVSVTIALFLVMFACSSRPDGVDVKPITSLQFTAGPDFLARVQRQFDGRAADWSKNGVGYLVYRIPNAHPGVEIFRAVNVFREASPMKAQEIYEYQRLDFTSSDSGHNWKLYREEGDAADKWFISYQGIRLNTNHGIPMGIITKPEIFIGILKQNVFIVISYTAYDSSWSYVRTINQDIRYVADLLSKATT